MAVDIRGLRAGYGGAPVLAIERLEIAASEHTLILGPSGSGKTTLLNVIAGIMPIQAGSVHVAGTRIDTMTEAARDHFRGHHLGFVTQRLHLIDALDVAGNLALARRLAGRPADGARILAMLTALGIADKAHARPRQLSQGEAQRAAIARALIHHPALVLADEPTAALDDTNCASAIGLLFEQAAANGATLIVATHDARIRARFPRVMALPPTS